METSQKVPREVLKDELTGVSAVAPGSSDRGVLESAVPDKYWYRVKNGPGFVGSPQGRKSEVLPQEQVP